MKTLTYLGVVAHCKDKKTAETIVFHILNTMKEKLSAQDRVYLANNSIPTHNPCIESKTELFAYLRYIGANLFRTRKGYKILF